VFGAVALTLLIRRRLGGIGGGPLLASVGRITLVGGATAAVAWIVARLLGDALGTETLADQAVQVFSAIAAGVAVFLAAAAAFRIDEVATVRHQLVARWRR
jgi:putative peptidoglycan lipid II flippase